jgi:hypothetical protein
MLFGRGATRIAVGAGVGDGDRVGDGAGDDVGDGMSVAVAGKVGVNGGTTLAFLGSMKSKA